MAVEWTEEAREALAEALCRTHNEDPPDAIPGASDPRNRVAACYECQRRADALTPFVAAREAQAAAKALREAADEHGVERYIDNGLSAWLRDRAARIERGGSDG